jgi:hypothetical protein
LLEITLWTCAATIGGQVRLGEPEEGQRFKSQNGSGTSDSLTAHPTAGTAYTDATATLFKN